MFLSSFLSTSIVSRERRRSGSQCYCFLFFYCLQPSGASGLPTAASILAENYIFRLLIDGIMVVAVPTFVVDLFAVFNVFLQIKHLDICVLVAHVGLAQCARLSCRSCVSQGESQGREREWLLRNSIALCFHFSNEADD